MKENKTRKITRHYNPKESLSHLIGDYKLLSPWNKFKINLIQLVAEWNVLSHNLSQQQTLENNFKYSDPYHNVAWREMYHPQVVKSAHSRFKKWTKYSVIGVVTSVIIYPLISKTLEIEKKRRELFISQKNTFAKERSI